MIYYGNYRLVSEVLRIKEEWKLNKIHQSNKIHADFVRLHDNLTLQSLDVTVSTAKVLHRTSAVCPHILPMSYVGKSNEELWSVKISRLYSVQL